MSVNERADIRAGYAFILIFALMTVGIIVTGYLHYRSYERNFRATMESELSSIAQLKVGELALWRKELLGDGAVLFKNAAFSALARRYLEQPGDTDAQRQLQAWMGKYLTAYQYTRVYLVDTQGRMRMSVPQAPEAHSSVASNVTGILRSGRVGIEDFHRDAPDGPIHLTVLVPIFDEQDYSRPLGVLALRIDPTTYLYPSLAHWPTPSQTAETLLVRRDGDDALFLSELRFHKNAPLNLRIPLTKTEVPAVMAALGQTGIVEGVDYRGAPVIVAALAVPDSPWSLVSRINTSEVYEPLRERLWQTLALAGFILLGAGAAMVLIWRQMDARYRERDKAEEKLRRSESLMAEAQKAARIGHWEWDIRNDALTWSDEMFRIYGYEPGAITPSMNALMDTVPPEDRERVSRIIKQSLDGAGRYLMDRVAVKPDGTRRIVHAEGEVERDETGAPLRMFAVVQDVTESKLMEERLQTHQIELKTQNQELLQTQEELEAARVKYFDLYNFAPVGYFTISGHGVVLEANLTAAELLRMGRNLMVNQPFTSLIASEDQDIYYLFRKRLFETGNSQRLEVKMARRDGSVFWVSLEAAVARDTQSETPVWHAAISDITERKKAENQMKLFRDALDLSSDAVLIMDGETARPVDFNKAAHEQLGYTREEMPDLSILDIIVTEPGSFIWKDRVKQVKESGGLIMERNHRRKDGSVFPVETALTVVEMEGKDYLVAVARDLTERVKIRELEITAKSLELTNRELAEFTHAASHDLQEPLRTIIAFSDRLEAKFGAELSPKSLDYLRRIRYAGVRMSQLLQDLLSYSLVSGGQLNFERVDLNQIVTEVLEDMRGTIEESGAGLSVSPLPVVSANPLQMRQMFQNLISNAIKYRKPGEHPNVRISTRGIKTPMGKRNSVWEVIVEDDGIGFDNEYAEKIFKLFERLHGHSEYDGTGVGLATALKIVQRHGWTIKAEGEPGVGAKFTILMISLEA